MPVQPSDPEENGNKKHQSSASYNECKNGQGTEERSVQPENQANSSQGSSSPSSIPSELKVQESRTHESVNADQKIPKSESSGKND